MIVNYTNTREDYEKAYERLYKVSRIVTSLQMGTSMLLLMAMAFYFIYEMSTFYDIGIKLYLTVTLILTTIYIVFYFLLKKATKINSSKALSKLIALNPSMIGNKSLEVSGDTLIYKSENGYLEYKVKAIDNIAEKDGRIILYIQKYNPIYVIPSISFNNEQDKNEFIKLIKN